MNYYNPYNVYGGAYPNTNYNQQSQQYQTPTIQCLPLTFVNGVVGAKAFTVPANQTYYLKDSDNGSNILFEKKSDSLGQPSLRAWELKEINIDDIGKPRPQQNKNFVTKKEIEQIEADFNAKINGLLEKINTLTTPNEVQQ